MKTHFFFVPFFIVVIGLIALPRAATATFSPPLPFLGMARGAGEEVVGDGTPGSCTDTALTQALAGGGHISFNCGSTPHLILLASQKVITAETWIDGGTLITLSGVNLRRHFVIDNSAILTVRNMTLTAGAVGAGDSGGSVQNHGVLVTENVTFTNNVIATGTGGGGAIYNNGAVLLSDTAFINNRAAAGGALLNTIAGTATITSSTFLSNSVRTPATGICAEDWGGGAIRNEGALTFRGGSMQGNQAIQGAGDKSCGGAINNAGTALLYDVDLNGNIGSIGSAIYALGSTLLDGARLINHRDVATDTSYYVILAEHIAPTPSTLVIRNSEIISNVGAGVTAYSNDVLIKDSTIANNTWDGIRLWDATNATIQNSTISGNEEGVVLHQGVETLAIINSTLVNDLTNISMYLTSSLSLQNTVLAGDPIAGNCRFVYPETYPNIFMSEGYNLSNDDTCPLTQTSDFPLTEPLLGPLQDNGGSTLTRLPAATSPLLEHGACLDTIPTDQRGVARPQGAACDIGAVERTPNDGATPTPTATITATPSATPSVTPTLPPTTTATPTPTGTPPIFTERLYLPLTQR